MIRFDLVSIGHASALRFVTIEILVVEVLEGGLDLPGVAIFGWNWKKKNGSLLEVEVN